MADLACGTVSVIGKALNYNCNAVRTIALVYAVLVVVLLCAAGSLLQQTVNVVVRDIVALCLLHEGVESGVVSGVSAAGLLDAYEDLTADLCKNLCSCAVLLALLTLDRTPF